MTREEQIQEAKDKAFPIPKEGRSYESAWAAGGFEMGTHWADEHPNLESLWHDVTEEPHDGSHILMQYNYEGDKELKSFHIKYDEYINWQKLIKICGISQWAYISDLLPKGGEQ